MRLTEKSKKDAVIEKVVGRLRARLRPYLKEPAARFTRQYYADLAPQDLLAPALEDLYGSALSHWNFARRRAAGKAMVRVYNPVYEEHGWQSSHTVVEIVTDDMPFLMDSVRMELIRHGMTVHLVIHPVMRVRRDRQGYLTEVVDPAIEAADVLDEAIMRFEVDQETESSRLEALQGNLERALSDVRAVVQDWAPMRAQLREVITAIEEQKLPIPEEDLREAIHFLRWVENHHFTFVGFRAYDLVERDGGDALEYVAGSGLGIFRNHDPDHPSRAIPSHLRALARAPTLLIITKSAQRSPVHRPSHLDYLGIKRFNDAGQVVGEWRFKGLYSSLAYSTRPSDIPLLRRKVDKVLERAALNPTSHAGKALRHILDTFPRDEMFQATDSELFEIAIGILQLEERSRLRLFFRHDAYGRFVSVLVYAPRDRYNTKLRLRLQQILMHALDGQGYEFTVQFSESVLARVHFIIRTRPGSIPQYDVRELEARMTEAMMSWEDGLHAALSEHVGEARGNKLLFKYSEAFPSSYIENFSARTGVLDILRLEEVDKSQELSMQLYRPLESPEGLLKFKVYGHRRPMALSDVLPMLERMGLRVLAARPYDIEPKEGSAFWILEFDMTPAHGSQVEVLEIKDRFQEAFARVARGEMESDGFNRLVLVAGLGWREVMMLRALCKYLLQTAIPFSQSYMEQSLAGNAAIARLLVRLFHARFAPSDRKDMDTLCGDLTQRIEEALDAVSSLDEDRILRRFLAVILAMVRTNYFQPDRRGQSKEYLSFKLDPSRIPDLPLPHPMFEIFVYSPRVEGVHLRGGLVARGGIRWSDRREDFRTEILGLMKAQMVKNAVIVPVGAKGGFITKQLPGSKSRDEIHDEVVACYRTYVKGLLDLTDNLISDEVHAPENLIRYDGDDPYLVVAADKGTATFSDIANAVASEYGFWLGDAFASGGAVGYDHKAMGITARGAWESVKRHFRELGIDTQKTPFSVVGIGDMSGDVFGNGMLLSPQIRLIAAFNHLHIFIDPTPDPRQSYAERTRLFSKPRSAWTDYSTELISAGGGVYKRTAKSITLSPEAQEALRISAERLTPNELIAAILRAPVDLLWNGGIGTYVKATGESHAKAGDRANDPVRINASELRCRVIGEGGNLGFTQLARIEFAHNGGLINTDAIDNSGGVDCSDHEVNIKILLDQVVRNGDMTQKQRNKLLTEMTEEVTQLVLRHNYLQTQAISVAAFQAREMLSDHARLMRALEQEKHLNRDLEHLPSDEELAEREASHKGLTRPEIAVLLAYGKIKLYQELITSDVAEDPYLSRDLNDYFPHTLTQQFPQHTQSHPLRREIIATYITNNLVNRMGSTFCTRLQAATGDSAASIARAYAAAREIFDVETLWAAIEALDNKISAIDQTEMIARVRRLIDRATLWLLRNRRPPLNIAGAVAQFQSPVRAIGERLQHLLQGEARDALTQATRQYVSQGIPTRLARRIAGIDALYASLDITEVATDTGADIKEVAPAYFRLGLSLDLHWLNDRIRELPVLNHWQRAARAVLRDELYTELRSLTSQLLRFTSGIKETEKRIEIWQRHNQSSLDHYGGLISDLKASSSIDLAMLAVATREVRNLTRHALAPVGEIEPSTGAPTPLAAKQAR